MRNARLHSTPPQEAFAGRLRAALLAKGKRASASAMEREFNLRWRGEPVSVTAARKWLMGLAAPQLDKLQVLARWLDVSEEWLRWGESGVNEHVAASSQQAGFQIGAGRANLGAPAYLSPSRASDEASLLQDYRMLQSQDKVVVRAIVEVLMRERRQFLSERTV